MRALIQRVESASVEVGGAVVGSIGAGLCAFIGVTHSDDAAKAEKLADKIWHLRVFEDADEKMNRSLADTTQAVLVVSQFTLYGDTDGGRRPGWSNAARPDQAEPLIEHLVSRLLALGATVETGRFRAYMKVELVNDGPATLLLET